MKFEKSCGAVVYYLENNEVYFLVQKMLKGHFSICKGHVENNETEKETAEREIKEETSLEVSIDTNFRETISYSPYEGCIKEVVFFIAQSNTKKVTPQETEVALIKWLTYGETLNILTYESDKNIVKKAHEYIKK